MEQSKSFVEEQRLRPTTSIRDRPERGEEQEVFRGESDGRSSPNPLQDDSTRDDAEAKNDFWSITREFNYRQHMELKCIDVTRTTHTSLEVLLEKILKITGTWMEKKNGLGQDSQDSFY